MGIENWTPDEEEQLLREIGEISRANVTYGNQATQQQSDASAEILLAAPNADPGLVLALSDMVSITGMSIEEAQQMAVEAVEFSMQQELERAAQDDGGGVFGALGAIVDYSFDQTKKLTRTGLASLETLWQLGTSAYSRGEQMFAEQTMSDEGYEAYQQAQADAGIIAPTAPASDIKTVFASTDLGSLILNKGQGGEGFFTAGPAKEMQEQAAIAYRGGVAIPGKVVDGVKVTPDRVVGYTPGRGLGFIAGQPGSKAYNTLSGAVDAAWAIAAPTGFGQALKSARYASDAIDQSSRVRQLWRSKNGLTNHVTPYIRKNKVESWLNGTSGQATVQQVVEMENISDARKLLPQATVDVWDELVKAKTPERAREILLGELGTGTQDIRNMSISRLSEVKRKILGNPFARHLGIEKQLGRRPESGTLLINGADDFAKTATIRNLEDYLISMKVEPDVRNPLINRFARALTSDKGDLENVVIETRDLFIEVFESKGLSREFLDGVFTTYLNTQKNSQVFNALESIEGLGALYHLVYRDIAGIGPEGQRGLVGRQRRDTAFLDPEGRNRGIELPAADRIIRAMSPYNWIFSRRGISQRTGKIINNPDLPARFKDQWGKPTLPLLGFKAIQNGLWKRVVLLQSSYAIRIMLSGLLRQSFTPGLRTGIQHPVETILAAMFRKDYGLYRGTILGEPWNAADKLRHSEDMKEFIRQTSPRLVGQASNKSTLELAQFRAGAWAPAARKSDNYVQGVMDNIHLLSQDRLTRMLVDGISVDDIIQKAKSGDRETVSAFKDLQARLENTLELADGSMGTPEFFDEAGNLVEQTAEYYLYDYFTQRIIAFTNNDPRIIEIIRNGQDGGRFIGADGNEYNAFLSLDGDLPPELYGKYSPDFQKVIEDILEQNPEAFPELVKARIPSAVVDSSDLSRETREFVERADEFMDFLFSEILALPDAYLNRSIVWRQNYWLSIEELLPQLDEAEAVKILENLREGYTFDLNYQVQSLRSAKRGPDGKFYVEGYKRPMDDATRQKRLDAAEAKLDERRQRGPNRKWMENWVGGRERFEVILDHAEGRTPATGSRTLEEINSLARVYATDQLKKTLYDVSGETNIESTIRVSSTFFGAWREGLQKSMKLIANNPQATKNFSVSYQALEDFDPDGDGRGFIYTHPQTGEQVFSYPANGLVGTVLSTIFGATLGLAGRPYLGPAAVTAGAVGGFLQGRAMAEQQRRFTEAGLPIPLVTPVASLNMEIHASPGIGGILQMPLNAILNRNVIPHSDDIARALLPYGAPANAGVPASIRRIAEAINNDPDRDSELATLRTEVLAGLYMAGGYERTNTSDMERLMQDSEDLAQVMLMLRGINHFFGPGRPRAELKIPTRFQGKVTLDDLEYYVTDGSIESRMLSEIYGRMYAENPETASIEFVAAFGNTSYGYLTGLTKANIPGIESSKEFYDWTIANKDIVKAYPNEYPWFVGNITNQYDNFVYRRQKEETRERIGWESPMARLEAAEVLHASRMYRTLLRAAGPDPDDATLAQLRAYKIELQEQYPAYKQQTFEIGALESRIEKIIAASRGDLLADNSAAESVRLYATARDEAIEAANARRVADGRLPATQAALSGNANADLRAVLRLYGESLAIYNPDFERVWSDVLFNEVDLEDS